MHPNFQPLEIVELMASKFLAFRDYGAGGIQISVP